MEALGFIEFSPHVSNNWSNELQAYPSFSIIMLRDVIPEQKATTYENIYLVQRHYSDSTSTVAIAPGVVVNKLVQDLSNCSVCRCRHAG